MDVSVLAPPIAFLVYLVLSSVLSMVGRGLSGTARTSPLKPSTYASGEVAPTSTAAPGYRSFFAVALFFAVLHLGVLVIGSSDLSPLVGVYLVGLILALVAFILG